METVYKDKKRLCLKIGELLAFFYIGIIAVVLLVAGLVVNVERLFSPQILYAVSYGLAGMGLICVLDLLRGIRKLIKLLRQLREQEYSVDAKEKDEYRRKPGEDYLEWLQRLHDKTGESGAITEANPELVTILINNIPRLISLI